MNTPTPETGRITLTLSTSTIKALRMLALLTGKTNNQVVEDLLHKGGLHAAVETQWTTGKADASPNSPPPAPASPVVPQVPSPARPAPPLILPRMSAPLSSPPQPAQEGQKGADPSKDDDIPW